MYYREFSASKNIKKAMFLLHGYGSNANDLISLAPDLSQGLEDVLFLSPNAPEEMPGGFASAYQWYDLGNRDYDHIKRGTEKAAQYALRFIEKILKEYSLNYSDIVIAGFSQGCTVALHLAYRLEKQIAGAIGLCGRLNMPNLLKDQIKSRPKTLLIHGAEDDVIIPDEMYAAAAVLKQNNISVETHLREHLGHGIDYQSIRIISEFLKSCY